jgi:hypothetical protein
VSPVPNYAILIAPPRLEERTVIDAFFVSPWPGILFWAALFISDSNLTVTCARMYQAGVREHIVFEGSYELTPYHQADIDALRRFSPRFLLALVAASALLGCLWFLSVGDSLVPNVYETALGALILIQLTIHLRHVRNYFLFRAVLAGEGIGGRIHYTRRTMLTHSSVELYTFAALYSVLCILTASWFIFGGAIACALVGSKHRQLAREHLASAAPA